MADLYNSDLGGNSRKTRPSSLFGTRELKFFVIGANYDFYHDDLNTDPGDEGFNADLTESYTRSDSLYSQVVQAIQIRAELYYLAPPNSFDVNNFVFGIAVDTSFSDISNYQLVFQEIDAVFARTPVGEEWGWTGLVDRGFGLIPGY